MRGPERATATAVPAVTAVTAWWPSALALALTVLLLGPALAPGFVLTYDMVWVPDLGLGLPALGLGTGLPRAVPSDAVVALLDEIVPGAWLQKVVLVGSLAGGAPGIARLCRGSAVAQAVAVTLWIWNPFVVERLLLGAWPVLVAYAVLPWVLLHGATWWRSDPGVEGSARSAAWLLVLVPLGSLSPSAGLMTTVALLTSSLGPRSTGPRRSGATLRAAALIAAAQAPWVVSGLLHLGAAASGVPGFEIFAPSSEGFGSPMVAALSWGGIWNTEVVPDSRLDLRGVAYLVVLLALASVGALRARRHAYDVPWRAMAACWAVGFGLVVVTTVAPGGLDAAARVIPGLALLRDGSRLLGLCVPLLAVAAGLGAAALAARASTWVRTEADGASGSGTSVVPRLVAAVVGLVFVLSPIALLPDAAAGVGGRLRAVDYPWAYASLPALTSAPAGATLVLPLTTYRAPAWNAGRPVLDPVPRLVRGDVVAGGGLVVSGTLLPGEDPREQAAARALALPGKAAVRRAALEDLGFGLVVVDGSAPGGAEAVRLLGLDGSPAAGPGPVVLRLDPGAGEIRSVPAAWAAAMTAAWAAYAGALGVGVILAVGCTRARRTHRS